MKHFKQFLRDETANIDMILGAIVAGVMFAIAIPIIYSVLGGINYDTIDALLPGHNATVAGPGHATNASTNLITNLSTFFSIGPLYLVVLAAVGIISAILMLRGR